MLNLINGSQTIGNGRGFWIAFLAVLAIALVYPMFADSYDVGNFSYFLIWIFMALGLSLIWGYGGMLSFGQTFFFGSARTAIRSYGSIDFNPVAVLPAIVHGEIVARCRRQVDALAVQLDGGPPLDPGRNPDAKGHRRRPFGVNSHPDLLLGREGCLLREADPFFFPGHR